MKKAYIFLFDGYSDWEIAFLTPELKKSKDWDLVYFSQSGSMVSSAGGLQIQPSISLENLIIEDIDLLVLPGGDAWEKGSNNALEAMLVELIEAEKPIAAICGATTFLGQLGILNGIKHTSNDLYYLKSSAPKYKGDENYQNTLSVTDDNIITANGIAPIEFSKHVFEFIELYESSIEKWFQLFKNGIWSE
ncbi:type 1 glutamine amidotransferase family protein [Marivirga harenae]|uniref:type 1 glutamine amidotransferase family protein n=1 Tax=Marivirga harenae TaxID=2010992 RepID=UPI0026E050DF|nr:type 1 glutamine amidotransferase family protein [Marivirga harenae]WKV11145.1 type 1 glutamine amidotransferase family protein [Marivirga harenae]|tara:strand:- start:1934 stop:2506 length:573 start_codon:yes stop_codon:yes gene_type:complete